jgi:hypothetical protein
VVVVLLLVLVLVVVLVVLLLLLLLMLLLLLLAVAVAVVAAALSVSLPLLLSVLTSGESRRLSVAVAATVSLVAAAGALRQQPAVAGVAAVMHVSCGSSKRLWQRQLSVALSFRLQDVEAESGKEGDEKDYKKHIVPSLLAELSSLDRDEDYQKWLRAQLFLVTCHI